MAWTRAVDGEGRGGERHRDHEGRCRHRSAVWTSTCWEWRGVEALKGAVAALDLCDKKRALSEWSRRGQSEGGQDAGQRGKSLFGSKISKL